MIHKFNTNKFKIYWRLLLLERGGSKRSLNPSQISRQHPLTRVIFVRLLVVTGPALLSNTVSVISASAGALPSICLQRRHFSLPSHLLASHLPGRLSPSPSPSRSTPGPDIFTTSLPPLTEDGAAC